MSYDFSIIRLPEHTDGTFGVFTKNNKPLCVTLEERWYNNEEGVSCIPVGEYQVKKYSGTKYKNVWKILNVPGRSDILIHWGNTHLNTEGCVLAASRYGKLGKLYAILNSKKVFKMLRRELPDEFTLNIRNTEIC